MNILRKLTSCLSSPTFDNVELRENEEKHSQTSTLLTSITPVDDLTKEEFIRSELYLTRTFSDISPATMISDK